MNNLHVDKNDEFREYLRKNLETKKQQEKADIQKRSEYLEKWPLDKIQGLTPEEYCLGTANSKNSLSYLMEFGKFGFGIGGATSKKHGVYYSKKEKSYMNGSQIIEDIDTFWPGFRDALQY